MDWYNGLGQAVACDSFCTSFSAEVICVANQWSNKTSCLKFERLFPYTQNTNNQKQCLKVHQNRDATFPTLARKSGIFKTASNFSSIYAIPAKVLHVRIPPKIISFVCRESEKEMQLKPYEMKSKQNLNLKILNPFWNISIFYH